MARPKGSTNKPKVELDLSVSVAPNTPSIVGHDVPVTFTQQTIIHDVPNIVCDPEQEPSIRQLRRKAFLAGARLKGVVSKEQVLAEIQRLGDPEPVPTESRTVKADQYVYAAIVDGFMFEVGLNGNVSLDSQHDDLDLLIDALMKFRDQADNHFDSETDRILEEVESHQIYLESVRDFDGLPQQPNPNHKRIMDLAANIGIHNADLNFAMIKILEAYGQPLGENVTEDDGTTSKVLFTPEQLEERCLKCMETPL